MSDYPYLQPEINYEFRIGGSNITSCLRSRKYRCIAFSYKLANSLNYVTDFRQLPIKGLLWCEELMHSKLGQLITA